MDGLSSTSEPWTSDVVASATSSAWDVIATAVNETWGDWDGGIIDDNGTMIDPVDGGVIDEGSYILNTILGLIIVLIASVLNALGLNITKLDHVRQQPIPRRQRKPEWMRFLWVAGMGTYIISQLVGSPLALRYLRPDWVAPLGSSSLVFNFLFANWLVGTPVTSTDIRGTVVIVLGVILILIFSSINHGLSQSISIDQLSTLWTRAAWLAYFSLLIVFTGTTYFVSHLLAALLASRASFSPLASPDSAFPTSRLKPVNPMKAFWMKTWGRWKSFDVGVLKRAEKVFARTDDARIIWLQGIGWAVAGGSLAGVCLVFTKAVVKIFWLPGHPLVHPSAFITLLLVIFTAVLQIVCLNRALVCADTVVVVPLFYAGYTVFGFVNSLVFFDQTGQYAHWVLGAVFVSIAILIAGVVLLSLKSSTKTASDPYTVSAEPGSSIRLRPQQLRAASGSGPNGKLGDGTGDDGENGKIPEGDEIDDLGPEVQPKGEDVLWEVGSVSDESNAGGDQQERKGVGGHPGGRGERRGLLDEEADDDGPTTPTKEHGPGSS